MKNTYLTFENAFMIDLADTETTGQIFKITSYLAKLLPVTNTSELQNNKQYLEYVNRI